MKIVSGDGGRETGRKEWRKGQREGGREREENERERHKTARAREREHNNASSTNARKIAQNSPRRAESASGAINASFSLLAPLRPQSPEKRSCSLSRGTPQPSRWASAGCRGCATVSNANCFSAARRLKPAAFRACVSAGGARENTLSRASRLLLISGSIAARSAASKTISCVSPPLARLTRSLNHSRCPVLSLICTALRTRQFRDKDERPHARYSHDEPALAPEPLRGG